MDELIQLVSEKTGIPKETAKTAVETVLSFLKDKLPAPIASQLDSLLSGAELPVDVEDLTRTLGGLLGNK